MTTMANETFCSFTNPLTMAELTKKLSRIFNVELPYALYSVIERYNNSVNFMYAYKTGKGVVCNLMTTHGIRPCDESYCIRVREDGYINVVFIDGDSITTVYAHHFN